MPYEVEVDERNQILILRFKGSSGLTDHVAAREEGARRMRELGFTRVLVDFRDAVNEMSSLERFEFGKSLKDIELPPGHRMAVAVRDDDVGTEMVVAVAQTKKVGIRAFISIDEARAWLLG